MNHLPNSAGLWSAIQIVTVTLSNYKINHSQDMCLLWVDAHGDIETPEVSPSKNMHGMPVSFHIKEMYPDIHYPDQVQQLSWFKP